MSLSVYIIDMSIQDEEKSVLYNYNITHNLNKMAEEAGLYKALWCPDELHIVKALELIEYLSIGLKELKSDPEYYKQFNPTNKWGSYDNLVTFTEKYLKACEHYPEHYIDIYK